MYKVWACAVYNESIKVIVSEDHWDFCENGKM